MNEHNILGGGSCKKRGKRIFPSPTMGYRVCRTLMSPSHKDWPDASLRSEGSKAANSRRPNVLLAFARCEDTWTSKSLTRYTWHVVTRPLDWTPCTHFLLLHPDCILSGRGKYIFFKIGRTDMGNMDEWTAGMLCSLPAPSNPLLSAEKLGDSSFYVCCHRMWTYPKLDLVSPGASGMPKNLFCGLYYAYSCTSDTDLRFDMTCAQATDMIWHKSRHRTVLAFIAHRGKSWLQSRAYTPFDDLLWGI